MAVMLGEVDTTKVFTSSGDGHFPARAVIPRDRVASVAHQRQRRRIANKRRIGRRDSGSGYIGGALGRAERIHAHQVFGWHLHYPGGKTRGAEARN
jgi:hypothetical protein